MNMLTIILIIAGLAVLAAAGLVLRARANKKKKISGKGPSDDIYPMW